MPSASAPAPDLLGELGAINVPKSCDVLAARLRGQILAGGLPEGATLPTERELVEATGLGRGSVREALRILEAQGLLRTRAGRYGGSVVSRPSDAFLASHIGMFAKGHGVSLRSLVEARQALEPMVARLAARHRTDDDLAQLQRIAARLDAAAVDDVPAFLLENANWHSALAAASHNDLLRAFTASISELMLEASRIENFASPEVRSLVSHAHRRILDAIAARDEAAAQSRAERDLQAYARHLLDAVRAAAAAVTAPPLPPRSAPRRPRGGAARAGARA
ncbi:MAG: FadR family transcriptional regulator [Burkholderiales bacterium]|nr:FadR family transcriptional regulator [Burkholderiales bacterium]